MSVAQVIDSMQDVLTTVADQAARETQFVKRTSKLSGAAFTQTTVFGWWQEPQARLEQLAQTATALGTPITAQGLDQRFTPEAAACLKQVLDEAVQRVVTADAVAIPLLQRFNGVYVQDSTTITLPDALTALWPGCGGQTADGTAAALKIQVQVNLTEGQLMQLALQAGRASDKTAPMQTAGLPAGALRIADLGYLDLSVWAAYDQQGVFWLSRYQSNLWVFTPAGQEMDLVALLHNYGAATLDQPVLLSQAHRLPCRLVAVRVPATVAAARRRKLKAESRAKGRTPSAKQLALCEWVLLVTNVPAARLSVEELLILARVRWQIELLFKLWKSHGQVDESRSGKPYRILCEVYAKLIAMVLQHWVLITSCWQYPNRSWFKAAQTIRQHVMRLACALHSPERVGEVLDTIGRCLAKGARLNTRKSAPNTYQLLLAFVTVTLD